MLILFAEPDCEPCDQLLRDLCREQDRLPWVTPVMIVSEASDADLLCRPRGWSILKQEHGVWTREFNVSATPFAYVLGPDRTVVASGIPNSRADLVALTSKLAIPDHVEALPVGAARVGGA